MKNLFRRTQKKIRLHLTINKLFFLCIYRDFVIAFDCSLTLVEYPKTFFLSSIYLPLSKISTTKD